MCPLAENLIDQSFQTSIDSTSSNLSGEFERVEDKYLVSSSLSNVILQKIQEHMRPSYPDQNTQFTVIESIYFDSPNLDFYHHHFLPMETRYKIRVRRYAPNGIWSEGPVLLELKSKTQGQSRKTRFTISADDLKRLEKGQTLEVNPQMIALNQGIKEHKLYERVNRINEIIESYHLIPIISIKYNRFAFEQDGLRVTIDQNLNADEYAHLQKSIELENASKFLEDEEVKIKVTSLLHKFDIQGQIILEVKHQGSLPDWLLELMNEYHIEQTSFSKYCWFMTAKAAKK